MAGGVVIHGTTDVARIEAPVTVKAYLICAFAAFGGIFFGYDTGWMSGVLAMPYFITQYTGLPKPAASDTAAVAAFHLTAQDQSLTTSILRPVHFSVPSRLVTLPTLLAVVYYYRGMRNFHSWMYPRDCFN